MIMKKAKTKIQNLINPAKKKRFSLKRFNQILFILIVIFGVYYLTCINDLSVKSFKMQGLKEEAARLNNENNNFEVIAMSLNSYNSLSRRVEQLHMVAVDKINYVDASVSAVAIQR